MNPMKIALLICLLGLFDLTKSTQAAEPRAVDFVSDVKPFLTSKCVNCHHAGALFGELNLENRAMVFKKRANGPVILPGRPDSSMLYLVLKLPPKNLKAMPPNGHRVSDQEVELIYDWIKQGASWPKGAAGVIVPTKAQ
jgi:mono/diheme cytochrome c family protein